MGAAGTRFSLRPLIIWANEFAKLGRSVSRECGGVCFENESQQ
jgi:hypothetical protein